MKWTSRHDRDAPPRSALVGSVLVHGAVALVAFLLALTTPEPVRFETYQITLVSPPPSEVTDIETPPAVPEELEIETPDPEPLPEPPPLPDPDAEPLATEPPPDSVDTRTQEEPEEIPPPVDTTVTEPETATTTEPPDEPTAETGEDIQVRMEGLRRDYPAYYGNILTQIRRCFRPPNTSRRDLRTVVYFVITPDGTVSEARLVERSGVSGFDYSALSAIADCAGKGRFGPLPDDLPYDRLPIQFEFIPPGEDAPATPVDAA